MFRLSLPKILVWTAIAIAVLVGLGLEGVSLVPYSTMLAFLGRFYKDPRLPALFTPPRWETIVLSARLVGGIVLLSAVALYTLRRWLVERLAVLAGSVSEVSGQSFRALRAGWRNESRVHLLALGLIIAAGIIIRLVYLFQPMRGDEAYTAAYFVRSPLFLSLCDYRLPNNQLLHTLLAHLSYRLFGYQEWAIRLPALLAGMAMIPAAYGAGRVFYNRQVGLLAAALTAGSTQLVNYSTNARGYTLVGLFFMLLLMVAHGLVRRQALGLWFFWVLLSVLAFYTIPLALYPFGLTVVWMIMAGRESRALAGRGLVKPLLLGICAVGLLSFLLYLPGVLVFGIKNLVANESAMSLYRWGDAPLRQWSDRLSEIVRAWNAGMPLAVQCILAAGAVLALVFHRRVSALAPPLIVPAVLWLVPVLAIQRVVPPERSFLFLLPVYLMMAGAGLVVVVQELARRRPGLAKSASAVPAVLSLLLCCWLVGLQAARSSAYCAGGGEGNGEKKVSRYLKANLRNGDAVLALDFIKNCLAYYGALDGIPREYYRFDISSYHRTGSPAEQLAAYDRVLLVVKEGGNEPSLTLEHMTNDLRLPAASFSPPRLIQSIDQLRIYEIVPAG